MLSICTTAMAAGLSRAGADFEYRISGIGIEITKYNGKGVSDVVVPEYIDGIPVTSIGTWAFTDVGFEEENAEEYSVPRYDIVRITLPETLVSIAPYAFDSVAALESIEVPDSVVSMGKGAFLHCTALTYVKLPAHLQDIPDEAFRGCGLETLTVPPDTLRIGTDAFAEEYSLKSVDLAEGLQEICMGAFGGDQMLRSIDIPDSVTEMGVGAFGLTGLVEVTIPENVRDIEAGLLMWCGSLEKVRFNCLPGRIDQNAFLGCPSLAEIEVDATESEWNQVTVDHEGNEDYLGAHFTYLRSEPSGSSGTEPAPAGEPVGEEPWVPGDISVRAGSSVQIEQTGDGWRITGYSAGNLSSARHDAELTNSLELPKGMSAVIQHTGSSLRAADSTVLGTGDIVTFNRDGMFQDEAVIVIRGDVLGSGVMGLSQLVRLAAALTGSKPLEGAYLEAGDLDGSGAINLSDVVMMAQMLKAN